MSQAETGKRKIPCKIAGGQPADGANALEAEVDVDDDAPADAKRAKSEDAARDDDLPAGKVRVGRGVGRGGRGVAAKRAKATSSA